ncbi:hypothetical protein TrRE_jg10085, partial [Triparma retinervis]
SDEEGNDIHNYNNPNYPGTITIHNTCPSPYSSNTPIQGSTLDTFGTVNGDAYSYSGCTEAGVGQQVTCQGATLSLHCWLTASS